MNDGVEAQTSSFFRLWLNMWTHPRATIREVQARPDLEWAVWALWGFSLLGSLLNFYMRPRGEGGQSLDTPGAKIALVFAFVVVLFVMFFVTSWLVAWTGRWLGGKAKALDVRRAWAWSMVPQTLVTAVLILQVASAGTPTDSSPQASVGGFLVLLLNAILQFTVSIWVLVISCKALGEVQGFSAWRGFGNWLLGGLLPAIAGLALGAVWVAGAAVHGNMRTNLGTQELQNLVQNVQRNYAGQPGIYGGSDQLVPYLIKTGAFQPEMLHQPDDGHVQNPWLGEVRVEEDAKSGSTAFAVEYAGLNSTETCVRFADTSVAETYALGLQSLAVNTTTVQLYPGMKHAVDLDEVRKACDQRSNTLRWVYRVHPEKTP